MAELKYKPVPHDHKAFLAKARTRKGFDEAYDALAQPKAQSPALSRPASTPHRLQRSSAMQAP